MAEEQKTETRTGTRFSYQTIENALGNVGKVPPQAVDFEQAVLGALMLDRDAITNVVNSLQPDMFYKEQHQEIYRAAKMLFQENEPIDLLTVSDWLRREKKLETAGGTYDSRDRQQNPNKGIYADAFLTYTAAFGPMKAYNNLKFNADFRHYVPVYQDYVLFAYRLSCQLTTAGKSPFYQNNIWNTLFIQRVTYEVLGGGNTNYGFPLWN